MYKVLRLNVGKKKINGLVMALQSKNLIVLKGSRGYVMCGYLNLKAAQKFKEAAVKITGVSTLRDALNARAHSCTTQAKKLGISKGQPIRDVLKIIA